MIAPVVNLDRPALYGLRALGLPSPIVLKHGRFVSPVGRYRIPVVEGMRQRYYRVTLRLRVVVDAKSGPGFGYVSALTDAGSSATVEVDAVRKRHTTVVRWVGVNTSGEVRHRPPGRVFNATLTNYILDADQRPGAHTLRFKLEQYRRLRFAEVDVESATGIQWTTEPPFTLGLSAVAVSPQPFQEGRPVNVAVEVHNSGRLPAQGVDVRVLLGPGLTMGAPGAFSLPWPEIPGRRAARRYVRLTPHAQGRLQAQFAVRSSHGSATDELVLDVSRPRAVRRKGRSVLIGLSLVVAAAVIVAFAAFRRRGRRLE